MSEHPDTRVPDVDERIADWVDERMNARERERFQAELRVSASLRQQVAEYEKTVAVVRAALRAPTQPVELADRVLATLAAEASRPPVRRLRPWPLVLAVASAAALLALAVWLDSFGDSSRPVGLDVARHERDEQPLAQGSSEQEEEQERVAGAAVEPQPAPEQAEAMAAGLPKAAAKSGDPTQSAEAKTPDEQVSETQPRELRTPLTQTPEIGEPADAGSPSAPQPSGGGGAGPAGPVAGGAAPGPATPTGPGGPERLRRGAPPPMRKDTGSDPSAGGPVVPGGVAPDGAAPGSAARVLADPEAGRTDEVAALDKRVAPKSEPKVARPEAEQARTGSDDFFLGTTRSGPEGVRRLQTEQGAGEVVAMLTLEGVAVAAKAGQSPPEPRGPVTTDDARSDGEPLDEAAKVKAVVAFLVEQLRRDAAPPAARRVAGLRLDRVAPASAPAAEPEARQPEARPVGVVERDWLVEGPAEDVALLLRELGRIAGTSGRTLRASEARIATAPDRGPGAGEPSARESGGAAPAETVPEMRRIVLRFRLRTD